MDYPSGFDTPAFPAGKRIAALRVFCVAIMVVFLLIVFACGMLLWVQKSAHVHPFLISINDVTGQWQVVGHQHGKYKEISTAQTLQESVLVKLLQNWFTITGDDATNSTLWQSCDRDIECRGENKKISEFEKCAIYCLSAEDVYDDFVQVTIPDYQARVTAGEMWIMDMPSLQILPIEEPNFNGGTWQIRANVFSNLFEMPMQMLIYANVSRDTNLYPQTMGYYISKINVYRIN